MRLRLRRVFSRFHDRGGQFRPAPYGNGVGPQASEAVFAKGLAAMTTPRVIEAREQDEIEETIALLAFWVMQMATATRTVLNDGALESANIACAKARETLCRLLDQPNGNLQDLVTPLLMRHARKKEIADVAIRYKDGPPLKKSKG
jgi:hypothetical protein